MKEDTQNILERKIELEKFLRDLDEIRREPDNMLSPLAGIFEKRELEQINKLLEHLGYPT